eukprot:jgi/Bigna1/144051/aug1.83_g18759
MFIFSKRVTINRKCFAFDRNQQRFHAVYDWLRLAKRADKKSASSSNGSYRSELSREVWRDLFVKFVTREDVESGGSSSSSSNTSSSYGDSTIVISPVDSSGLRRVGSVQQMTEGVMLRLLFMLQALYPFNVIRCGELRFRLRGTSSPTFMHLLRCVQFLAFGTYDDGQSFAATDSALVRSKAMGIDRGGVRGEVCEHDGECGDGDSGSRSSASRLTTTRLRPRPSFPCPVVKTALWEHQCKAVGEIMAGISAGKRGFADASAVGAGKTLTALGSMCEISRHLEERRVERKGFLVLVPTNPLINEWANQALIHTRGFDIICQKANGRLVSKGVSSAGVGPPIRKSEGNGRNGKRVERPTQQWEL